MFSLFELKQFQQLKSHRKKTKVKTLLTKNHNELLGYNPLQIKDMRKCFYINLQFAVHFLFLFLVLFNFFFNPLMKYTIQMQILKYCCKNAYWLNTFQKTQSFPDNFCRNIFHDFMADILLLVSVDELSQPFVVFQSVRNPYFFGE